MSRRAPNPAADRAAQNQQTIKTLLKLEGNKACADCKRNKHPRWASWNLGIFVCIRCSGIHRGMGTHISRVKSVDLDAWTDEQLQSVLKWGNSRANKYWESKLAPGHAPSEAKIENFIRTKYESKRWVMDGPMPDPSTLDEEGDDDVPLNVVQEKAKLDRSASQRASSTSSQPPAPIQKPPQTMDILGELPTPPARPTTTDTVGARPPPPRQQAPPKAAKPADSLLGLDFFGGPASQPAGASNGNATSTVSQLNQSRPDLKQSILSLYASAPKTQPSQEQAQQHQRQPSFGGMHSPPPSSSSNIGGLNDAFSGLGFSSATSPPPRPQQQMNTDFFSNYNKSAATQPQKASPAPPKVTPSPLSGGNFFDTGPKPAPKADPPPPTSQPPKPNNILTTSDTDFGDFSFASSPPKPSAADTTPKRTSGSRFDMSGFASKISSPFTNSKISAPFKSATPTIPAAPPPTSVSSPFNLSNPSVPPTTSSAPAPAPAPPTTTSSSSAFSNISNADVWGSDDAWGSTSAAAPAQPAPRPEPAPANSQSQGMDSMTWPSTTSTGIPLGGSASRGPPKITQDEDFGGWSSAVPAAPSQATQPAQPATSTTSKPSGGGFGGGDDLFSNVWG